MINRDDIIRMARQADSYADAMDIGGENYIGLRDEYFAKLVAAAEREAMVVEAAKQGWAMKNEDPFEDSVRDIADIRSRSQQ